MKPEIKKHIEEQTEKLRQKLPPWPATHRFPKGIYTRTQVFDMIAEAIEFCKQKDIDMEFEYWLNDKWLNGNNGDNEDMYEEFIKDLVDSFMRW